VKTYHFILVLLSGFLLSTCGTTNQAATKRPTQAPANIVVIDGNCYKKYSLLKEQIDEESKIPIYNGTLDQLDERFIDRKIIEITPQKTNWVKRSKPGQKELVWCLEEQQGEYAEVLIVRDTNAIKSFEYHPIQLSKKDESGTFFQMEQLVCDGEESQEVIASVCQSLLEGGYTQKCNKTTMTNELNYSLMEYQKDHKLPIGLLNYKTLTHMGINL